MPSGRITSQGLPDIVYCYAMISYYSAPASGQAIGIPERMQGVSFSRLPLALLCNLRSNATNLRKDPKEI
jgi:hypothetical protein